MNAPATPSATPAKRPAGRGRNLELPEHLKAYKGVWVFIEHDRGHVHSVSWELLGEARKLADILGSQVGVVVLGGPEEPLESYAAEAFTFGADKAYIIHDPVLKGYRNEPFTKGLTDLVNKYQPEILLLGATSMGRDLAGSVATTLLTGLTADCTELAVDTDKSMAATRPTFGGSLLCTIHTLNFRPQMATVRPRVMAMPEPDRSRKGQVIHAKLGMVEADIVTKVLDYIPDAAMDQAQLAYADIVVAGGMGLQPARKTSA